PLLYLIAIIALGTPQLAHVCEGKATIKGTRMTVEFVLKLLGAGYRAEDLVREYPALKIEDVYECATYGAWLASNSTVTVG
ncbi:MAG: DUF433 domain-containing protein, partial [Spirochaetaceae bacterium]|nr:DUF433 domain-containing protein [Spirochaetaceae bacterium]